VVHNGIIENHRSLRESLEMSSSAFLSQTDTEVIPHLIARQLRLGLPIVEAILRTTTQLRGSYALAILHDDAPDRIFAVRNGSPLVLGIGNHGHYIASDVTAILPYTRKVVFLEDGHLAILQGGGIELKTADRHENLPLTGRIVSVDWSPAMAEKQGYEHFMLKEIYEQPQGLRTPARMDRPIPTGW